MRRYDQAPRTLNALTPMRLIALCLTASLASCVVTRSVQDPTVTLQTAGGSELTSSEILNLNIPPLPPPDQPPLTSSNSDLH